MGPSGYLVENVLDVRHGAETVPATVAVTVPARQGSLWADTAIPTADLPPTAISGIGVWTDPAPKQTGVRNFIERFTIVNTHEYEVAVRIRISNHHDFELLLTDPFVPNITWPAADPALPPLPDQGIGDDLDADGYAVIQIIWVEGGTAEAPGTQDFWIRANPAGIAGVPNITVGGTAVTVPTSDPRHHDALFLVTATTDLTVAGAATRTTQVQLETERLFAPWVRFPNDQTRFSFTLTATLE